MSPKPNVSFLDRFGERHFVERVGWVWISVDTREKPRAPGTMRGEMMYTLNLARDQRTYHFEFDRENERDAVRRAFRADDEVEFL